MSMPARDTVFTIHYRSAFWIVSLLGAFAAMAATDGGSPGQPPSWHGRGQNFCSQARLDRNIFAEGLGHNSFEALYRSPFGAVKTNQGTVTLRLRACKGDLDRARVRLWHSVEKREIWVPMTPDASLDATDPTMGPLEFWSATVQVPSQPTILYYFFEASDQGDTHYYVSHNSYTARGGWGRYSRDWNDKDTFQISVYDKDFRTPDWFKGSVMYQILPDRFRNGDRSNDPIAGTGFVFGKKNRVLSWKTGLCDPYGPQCPGESDNQFYGGDLQGVLDKLDYLKELGVKVIYFNPVFQSATNHRYDTQDYYAIDSKLGDMARFETLLREGKARGIEVVLDGVFNHGSADSPYFDVFGRYDGAGACKQVNSPFRKWFYFPHFQNRPFDHSRPGVYYYCEGPYGTPTTYESWWGYYEHPVYNKFEPVVRDYFYQGGPQAVGPFWIAKGTGGWRLDVAGDVAAGEGADPANTYWQGFRLAIKAMNPQAVMIGEEWANASPWLLGHEWDSATNYRFRTALLNWLADRCVGQGCTDGTIFQDDDNNWKSSNGPIMPIDEAQFDKRLRSIQEDYPPEAWHSMMNPLGSHDTQRALFVLKKVSGDRADIALQKLRLAALFQMTYPGVPVIYYGDEAGVAAEGQWHDGTWKDDPYTRAVYPWEDEGLTPDRDLIAHFTQLANIRNRFSALRTGDYQTVLANVGTRQFIFRRQQGSEVIWVALNRANTSAAMTLTPGSSLPEGAVLQDVLNGGTFTVRNGTVDLGRVAPYSGRILVVKNRSSVSTLPLQ